jgi:predicted dienelactone hydrolase
MYARKLFGVIMLCLTAALAQAAGLRTIDVAADATGPALNGAVWYPCSLPPGEVDFGKFGLPGVKDCPLPEGNLPLIVFSHGRRGNFAGHHDTATALADAGFVVAAINHPGDTVLDLSRTDELAIHVERPNDIRRLIDFMLGPVFAPTIDRERIGLFGFSRGGYTGLAVIGASPDWANATARCQQATSHVCEQVRAKQFPGQPVHDPRVKAAVIADPPTVFFTADSFAAVKIPVQLWASDYGGDGVPPHASDIVDQNLSSRHEYHVVPNSGHFAFLAPCPSALIAQLPQLCVDTGGFDRIAFHRQFNADVLAFFRAQLMNAPR